MIRCNRCRKPKKDCTCKPEPILENKAETPEEVKTEPEKEVDAKEVKVEAKKKK